MKPGILETLTTLGIIVKFHLSLEDAMGKRLFERKDAKIVVLKTGQNHFHFGILQS